MPRPWSARMRCAFVAAGESPYATPGLGGDPLHDSLVAVRLVDGRTSCRIAAPRSSPRPVSMFCFGSGVSVPSACSSYSMKTRFQNSRKRSQRVHRARSRARRSRAPRPSPSRARVGAAGAGPADRPEVLGRRQRDDPLGGIPTFFQSSIATSSARARAGVAGVDAHPDAGPSRAACARGRTRVASSIAPSLKYCPNEKLPSISKNVRWWPSSPTSSMSAVRKHFCDVVVSGAGRLLETEEERHLRLHARGREQRRVVVRSRDERRRGRRRWPFSSKNERKPSRSSAVVRIPGFYERGEPGAVARRRAAVLVRRPVPRRAQLLVELGLAARGGVLRDRHRLARVAARTERGQTPCDTAGREPADLLHRRRDRRRDGADRGVGALGHRDGAVRHDVELVELVVHAVDRAAGLDDHRQQVALGALDERREPRERPAEADEHVRERRAPLATKKRRARSRGRRRRSAQNGHRPDLVLGSGDVRDDAGSDDGVVVVERGDLARARRRRRARRARA